MFCLISKGVFFFGKKSSDCKDFILLLKENFVLTNFILLTQVFTKSPFDTVLLRQKKSMEIFGNYDDEKMKEDERKRAQDEI